MPPGGATLRRRMMLRGKMPMPTCIEDDRVARGPGVPMPSDARERESGFLREATEFPRKAAEACEAPDEHAAVEVHVPAEVHAATGRCEVAETQDNDFSRGTAEARAVLRAAGLRTAGAMAGIACLGAGVAACAEHFDVARSIAIGAGVVGAASAVTAEMARKLSGWAMALGFLVKMAAILGILAVFDGWSGLHAKALVLAVALGIVVSLAVESWTILRWKDRFEVPGDQAASADFAV